MAFILATLLSDGFHTDSLVETAIKRRHDGMFQPYYHIELSGGGYTLRPKIPHS